MHHIRNRLCQIQPFFRRNALYGFWSLNRFLLHQLYFLNRRRRHFGRRSASSPTDADAFTRVFGSAAPGSLPESTEWWRRQSRELFAITDEAECKLMQAMVTISHNDGCAEMLAAIRRGPGSPPTNEELIEYLVARKRHDQERPPAEHYSLEHVLSYQRRIHAVKHYFFKRGKRTPLGRMADWWDRTEAQMRGSLHAHILVWFWRRTLPARFTHLTPIARDLKTTTPSRQRPRGHEVPPQPGQREEGELYQEDNVYHYAEVGRVQTEMVRPFVRELKDRSGRVVPFVGFTFAKLKILKTFEGGTSK